jgi:hypothetical protein
VETISVSCRSTRQSYSVVPFWGAFNHGLLSLSWRWPACENKPSASYFHSSVVEGSTIFGRCIDSQKPVNSHDNKDPLLASESLRSLARGQRCGAKTTLCLLFPLECCRGLNYFRTACRFRKPPGHRAKSIEASRVRRRRRHLTARTSWCQSRASYTLRHRCPRCPPSPYPHPHRCRRRPRHRR